MSVCVGVDEACDKGDEGSPLGFGELGICMEIPSPPKMRRVGVRC